MKGHTNNPNGRPPKSGEKRKTVSYRITPEAAEHIKMLAKATESSQSDIVEHLIRVSMSSIGRFLP